MKTKYQNRLKWFFTVCILIGVYWTIFAYDENDHPLIQYLPLLVIFIAVVIIGVLNYVFLPVRRLARLTAKHDWSRALRYADRLNLASYKGDEKIAVQIYIMTALFADGRKSEAEAIYNKLQNCEPESDAIKNVIDSWADKFQ